MTELDRQGVDEMAQKIINYCTTQLNIYKQNIYKQKHSKQKAEHYESIINSIDKYLKHVSKIYTEAKAIRVKRVLEAHKLSKLETKSVEVIPTERKLEKSEPLKNTISAPIHTNETIENQLSAEEMQMFESENDFLFEELNTLSDEVKEIESKVVHISELQELFTEKVLQQEQDIERIATTVAASTDNMKDANEQIRQAIQRNAGLRVWVLFFLLVMSFSLLFLDCDLAYEAAAAERYRGQPQEARGADAFDTTERAQAPSKRVTSFPEPHASSPTSNAATRFADQNAVSHADTRLGTTTTEPPCIDVRRAASQHRYASRPSSPRDTFPHPPEERSTQKRQM
ncbi:hypothetical protein RN001_004358 [Aquatica leii]|uniref:Syntaxin-18 n=1 Tax=Aquatica leii TaxID=1421715 RepID=A0AAN7SI08_9COLE|nr:hypothetical protein RN001_004358 [Aquatica leii]